MQRNALATAIVGPSPSDPALKVYYDGGCPVCSREIATYRRQAGAERCFWLDVSSCTESALGTGLSRDSALAQFHVWRADGVVVDGVRGFAVLWRVLHRFAWAGRIASARPLPLLLDAACHVFLRTRPLWQSATKVTSSKGQR